MKSHLLPILALTAILTVACKSNEAIPVDAHQLVGLWGMSFDKNAPANGLYDEYLRFLQDGTFEYYTISADSYAFHRGSFQTENGQLTLIFKKQRVFQIVDSVPRCTRDNTDSDYWTRGSLTFTAIADKMITTKSQTNTIYMHAATQLTPEWNDEISAPEITVSESNLVAQWDLVSLYQLMPEGSNWWYTYVPEKTGITLLANNSVGDCAFFANMLAQNLQSAGGLDTDEGVYIYHNDCPWYLNGDTLKLTCTKYTIQKFDTKGNIIDERIITPVTPVVIPYKVHMLSAYYLIIYNPGNLMYYAFHKHAPAKANAPQAAPADGKVTPLKDLLSPQLRDNRKISELFL